MRALASGRGTLPSWMRRARPSAMAVLPTPGSPTRSGLFLRRRHRTWIARSTSESRPTSGSILPSAARWTRSVVNCSSGRVMAGSSSTLSSPSPAPRGLGRPLPASTLEMPWLM